MLFNPRKKYYKKKAQKLQEEIWDLEFEKLILNGAVSGTEMELEQFRNQVIKLNGEIQELKNKEKIDKNKIKKIIRIKLDLEDKIKKSEEGILKGFREQLKNVEFQIRSKTAKKKILEGVIKGKEKYEDL